MFFPLACHQISTSAAASGLCTEHSNWAFLPSSAVSRPRRRGEEDGEEEEEEEEVAAAVGKVEAKRK